MSGTSAHEPGLHLADDVALWAEVATADIAPGRPALFLDRDGVLVDEVHFLKQVEHVRLSPDVAEAIRAVNAAGYPVIVVTNQSGIARGHLGWRDFAAVQAEIATRLTAGGARVDAVFACGFYPGGNAPFNIEHDWRKPGPGMLLEAKELMGVDLGRSVIIGDRVSDLEAGLNAGLKAGLLVRTGYGKEHAGKLQSRAPEWAKAGFATAIFDEPADAVRAALELLRA